MTGARDLVQAFLQRRDSSAADMAIPTYARQLVFEALGLLADHYDERRTQVTPVATTPRTALRARRSEAVIHELIDEATEELIVLGYEVSDSAIIGALAERASLGVSVDLLVDSVQTPLDLLASAWPERAGPARVWSTTLDNRGKPFRLHAKALIADGHRCMVGSANMTHSGMQSNLELGVLLEGAVVPRFRAYIRDMVRLGIVVHVRTLGEYRSGSGTDDAPSR